MNKGIKEMSETIPRPENKNRRNKENTNRGNPEDRKSKHVNGTTDASRIQERSSDVEETDTEVKENVHSKEFLHKPWRKSGTP